MLAVIAAVIGVFPALRLLEVQQDALRPRPTPYFDLGSRYDLLQLKIRNLGAAVAYDVSLNWNKRPLDYCGNEVTALDRVAVLLPDRSVSVAVGAASGTVRQLADARFEGTCRFRDASGRWYEDAFVCSVDGSLRQLIHDEELPKTLRDLQKLPEGLDRIAQLLEKLETPKAGAHASRNPSCE